MSPGADDFPATDEEAEEEEAGAMAAVSIFYEGVELQFGRAKACARRVARRVEVERR